MNAARRLMVFAWIWLTLALIFGISSWVTGTPASAGFWAAMIIAQIHMVGFTVVRSLDHLERDGYTTWKANR